MLINNSALSMDNDGLDDHQRCNLRNSVANFGSKLNLEPPIIQNNVAECGGDPASSAVTMPKSNDAFLNKALDNASRQTATRHTTSRNNE